MLINFSLQRTENTKRHLLTFIYGYHLVEHMPCHLLSINVTIKIHKTIILLFVLYGCEPWSVMLNEEHRLWVNSLLFILSVLIHSVLQSNKCTN